MTDQVKDTQHPSLNECCIQTLLAYRRRLEHGSRTTGPVAVIPASAKPFTKEFTAMDLMERALFVHTCDIDQVPIDTAVLLECGVQKFVGTKGSDSHVNTNEYRANIGTQAVTPGSASCGVQAARCVRRSASHTRLAARPLCLVHIAHRNLFNAPLTAYQ